MEECPLKAFHHHVFVLGFFYFGWAFFVVLVFLFVFVLFLVRTVYLEKEFLIFGFCMKLVPQSSSTGTAVSLACGLPEEG